MFILYYFSTNYFSLFHCFFSLIFYRFSIIDSLLLTTFGQQLSYDSLINHILLNICIYYLKAHKRNYRYFSRAIRYLCKFMLFDLFYFFNTLALIFFQLLLVITFSMEFLLKKIPFLYVSVLWSSGSILCQ